MPCARAPATRLRPGADDRARRERRLHPDGGVHERRRRGAAAARDGGNRRARVGDGADLLVLPTVYAWVEERRLARGSVSIGGALSPRRRSRSSHDIT